MTTAKLPESWRPESLLQSRAEALSKETGLPLADAVEHIEAETKRNLRGYFDELTAKFGSSWHCDEVDDPRMDAAFEVFGDEVYEEGLASFRRAKGAR